MGRVSQNRRAAYLGVCHLLLVLFANYVLAELIGPGTDQQRDAGAALVLELNENQSAATRLADSVNGIEWLARESPLYEIDQIGPLSPRLTVQRAANGEAILTLQVHNPTDRPVRTDIRFPILRDLTGGDPAALTYCYPRQDLILGREAIELDEPYSSRFPLQFVTVYQPGQGGVYLITCDTELQRKRYFLTKSDRVVMGACYPDQVVEPGQTLTLPAAKLGVYSGDWHAAFDAYREWTTTWYQPVVDRKPWFRRVFNFRQIFLYPNLDTPGLFQPAEKSFTIASSLEDDLERFGGVDYVHLFDWSQTPDQGRVGMYSPWRHLPRERFNQELNRLRQGGAPVGLYFEGYLVSPAAEIPARPGRAWQLRKADGEKYDPFGSGDDYLCPAVPAWRDHLTQAVVRAAEQTPADGFYIDQFGFGYQYPCHHPDHGHELPSNQPLEETRLIRQVRAALAAEKIIYTEQTPVDVAMQYQDGSFSYSLLHARHKRCPSRMNLSRFAFPDFKTIQILRGDGPIGDDVRGVHLTFFHGDGLWLVGPSDNPRWYAPEVLQAIRKTHAIKTKYADAFASDIVAPLVTTLSEGVYANRFSGENRIVWTLYNSTDRPHEGSILRVRHNPGDRYTDSWNGAALLPDIRDGWTTIELALPAGAVGCVVQYREAGKETAD